MFRNDFQEQQMAPVMSKLQDESFLALLEMVFLRLPKLKRFPVPVLVVGAEKDYLISIKDTQRMARHYGVDALIVKDASHCLMLETGWEMVAEKIKSFAHQH
jgi:alpha-beta hydrolase superfamily lysophospholipase